MQAVRSSVSRSFANAGRFFSSSAQPKRTALYNLHLELNGKMVEFGGYELPVQYPEGVLKSHLHTRQEASLFDVSHMGQLRIHGKDRVAFLERLVVADVEAMPVGETKLSLLTNERGGIIDDTVITKQDNHIYMVVNAGCKDKDIAHINRHAAEFKASGKDVSIEIMAEHSLIALQGPKAAAVLQRLTPVELSKLGFMHGVYTKVDNIDCIVTRCGYTGEDGFEVSVPNSRAIDLAKRMLAEREVLAAGLGARDSLRLEAGLCLYGHDISEEVTPIEATLAWTIGKRRKEQGGFLGSDVVLKQIKDGVSKKRVGFFVEGAPAREHTEILSESGEKVGVVTSGTFAPCLKKPVAMGYVSTPLSKVGTKLQFVVRGKNQKGEVTKMPFVPTSYYKV
eukprot:GILI01001454.1.p1 GENE.GILI01001454.1~~GILI01001454.1.p1  ORF type:complete len:404 (-),score=158.08 GILI01001454.1:137-1318(-)